VLVLAVVVVLLLLLLLLPGEEVWLAKREA